MSRFFSNQLGSLSPYTPGEQPQVKGLIKLNTNENPYGPGPEVARAIKEQSADRLRLYPDPACGELISAIQEYYGLSAGQVMVGNGSDELLGFAFMAFCDEDWEIRFPEISYGFYPVFANVFKTNFDAVPLKENLTIDPADYYNSQGTVVLANPNAPTGIGLSRTQIEGILQNNPDNLVIIDEAYVDFGGETCIPLIADYDNLLVIQTFSKSRSLAGCRVGFALGNPEIINDLNRIKFSFNPYNLDSLSIQIAAAAMKDRTYFEATCQEIMNTREWFSDQMTARGFTVLPSQANFVFVKCSPEERLPGGKSDLIDGKGYFEALRQKNILVRYFEKPKIQDYVRITIGTKGEMEELLAATDAIFRERNARENKTQAETKE
jgi:histidinol-phosphate aminotransferase